MKIAVISDTHDRVPSSLVVSLAEADEIWHLGDVCEPCVIDEFLVLGKPMKIVRGNCDWYPDWPLTLDFMRAGLRVRLVHIPPGEAPGDVDLLLHGHTHVPRDEKIGACRFLNPGCVTRPNRGAPASFAWLDLKAEKRVSWRVELL